MKSKKLKKYGFEFLSMFIAVISAFALNNWNENRNADKSENKILIEIANGLEKDIEDIRDNKKGHVYGISACNYFSKLLIENIQNRDSIEESDSLITSSFYYLTRDFISIQNTAGYETLKSRGLELIKNDSLRLQIISLYEFNYKILRKMEEEYSEMQFHKSYFKEINEVFAPSFLFDVNSEALKIDLPIKISKKQKKIILLYFWKIIKNRKFILKYYDEVEKKVIDIHKQINTELNLDRIIEPLIFTLPDSVDIFDSIHTVKE